MISHVCSQSLSVYMYTNNCFCSNDSASIKITCLTFNNQEFSVGYYRKVKYHASINFSHEITIGVYNNRLHSCAP